MQDPHEVDEGDDLGGADDLEGADEDEVESQFVEFLEGLSERMEAVEDKNNKMDKALASSLRAIGALVQDIVIVIEPNTSEEAKAVALNRVHKFVNTIKTMDKK